MAGTVDAKQSLEMLIAQADGAVDGIYTGTENDKAVGHIEMTQVYKALVRYNLNEQRRAK